jgi:hypothetical protein
MAFVQRDHVFLWLLFEYRYLRSGQLAVLAGRSNQVVRRRMRALNSAGLVLTLKRYPMEEQAYTLGPMGYEIIAHELGTQPAALPFSKKAPRLESLYLGHTLLTNQTRISMTLATQEHAHVALHRTTPEWEMSNPAEKKDMTRKFVLWERLSEKRSPKKYVSFRPDCLFLIHRRDEGPDRCVAMFLEADRGSQSIERRIGEKYRAYFLYFQRQCYWRFFKAVGMRVLFVLEEVKTDRRIRAMQRLLQAHARLLGDPEGRDKASFVSCFRFTRSDLLNAKTALDADIWQDWKGEQLPLFSANRLRAAG